METTKEHIEIPSDIPAFTPTTYEIKSHTYGDTGGCCTVGTIEFYLPETDRTVWVNCTDESATVCSADIIWNSDDSDSCENPSDYTLAGVYLHNDKPKDFKHWLPMIKETLTYTTEQELEEFCTFTLPVDWLPDSIRKNADPEHLNWLREQGKCAEISVDGIIAPDADYCKK